MPGAGELDGRDPRNEEVQDESRRAHDSRRDAGKRHHREVRGGAAVPDRGIQHGRQQHAERHEDRFGGRHGPNLSPQDENMVRPPRFERGTFSSGG